MSLSAISIHFWTLPGMVTTPLPRSNALQPFSQKVFPNVLPWGDLRPFPLVLSLVASVKRLTHTFQVVVESNKVFPEPPFLQAKQPHWATSHKTCASDPSPALLCCSGHILCSSSLAIPLFPIPLIDGHHICRLRVSWALLGRPGLLRNDWKWLCEHFYLNLSTMK